MKVIRNNTIGNAILRQMAKENNFDIDNIFLHSEYKYICTIDVNKRDADFSVTIYKGNKYKVQYLSGCFNPFIVLIEHEQ